MIKGSKKWTLIDPKYSIFLKGRVSQSGIHAQTLFDMPDTDISVEPEILHHSSQIKQTLQINHTLKLSTIKQLMTIEIK